MSDQSGFEGKNRQKLLSGFKIQMVRLLISIICLAIAGIFVPVKPLDTVLLIFFLSPTLIWSYVSLHELFVLIGLWTAIEQLRRADIGKTQNTEKGAQR